MRQGPKNSKPGPPKDPSEIRCAGMWGTLPRPRKTGVSAPHIRLRIYYLRAAAGPHLAKGEVMQKRKLEKHLEVPPLGWDAWD